MPGPPSRKRPREVTNINTGLVEIYEDLASENGEIRLKAALRLLSAKYSDAELETILKRLLRGLCSGRKAARLGFSVALTEFLSHYTGSARHFSPEFILQVLKEQTDPIAGASGQELRDYYFGRLFAAEAIIKAKILHAEKALPIWTELVSLILDLYGKKQWLREECGWVLYQALLSLKDQPNLLRHVAVIFKQLGERSYLKSLESISLWIVCRLGGGFQRMEYPRGIFKNDSPFDPKENHTLINALKGATTTSKDDEGKGNQSNGTTWSNKLHFAWLIIFDTSKTVSRDGTRHPDRTTPEENRFSALWNEFVDAYLFADSASEQRKYWGFLMMQHYIKDDKIQGIIGSNFLRCFSNQLAKSDRHLHGIASKTLKTMYSVVANDSSGKVASRLLTEVVALQEFVDFDKVTKTKFLEKLVANAEFSELNLVVASISKTMVNANNHGNTTPSQWRIQCADFMLLVVKNYIGERRIEVQGHQSLREQTMYGIIESLTHLGYCKEALNQGSRHTPVPEVDQQTRDIYRTRLLSVLSHLMTQTDDPSVMPVHAANLLLGIKKSMHTPPMSQSKGDILAAIKRAGSKMKKFDLLPQPLPTQVTYVANAYHSFRLLFSLSIIQAFSGDADAIAILEELEEVADGLLSPESQDVNFSAVVEIILSMIAKPSVLFRRVGKEVFSSCIEMIDLQGLEAMFEILGKSENLSGQQELFEAEDDDDGMVEDDSDVMEVEDDSSSETGESTAANEIEGDESDDNDAEVIEFENKLAQALGTKKANVDPSDDSGGESDEDIMDDDQMAALDPMMSNMFKQRKQASSKKEHKNAKDNIVQFKTKVLELLEIYVQQAKLSGANYSTLMVLDQCLLCIKRTNSKQVSEKAAAVIKAASNAYKLSTTTSPRDEVLKSAKKHLHLAHEYAIDPNRSNLYYRTCSLASLYYAKVMLNHGGTIDKVWKEYCKTGEIMATNPKSKVTNILFQDWFNWLVTAKITLSKRDPAPEE